MLDPSLNVPPRMMWPPTKTLIRDARQLFKQKATWYTVADSRTVDEWLDVEKVDSLVVKIVSLV